MRATLALLLLLLWGSVELGGGNRHRGGRGRARGKARGGTAKRFVQECMEYTEAGERYLDCQKQGLSTVPTGWHANVHHLLLAHNRIRVLENNAFTHFPGLRSLDLQQNELTRVAAGAFAGLVHLNTLLLQHNALRQLGEEMLLPLARLTYLRIYDNPWDCRCSLDSLVRTLQVPSNRNLGNFAECAEPPELRGLRLKRLRPEVLCPELEGNTLPESGRPVPQPPPSKELPHATTVCHTYMFPKPLLDCQNRDLKNVPADLPSDTVKMDLSKNRIQHLRAKMFLGSKDLKLLNLSSNGLERIDTAAFAGLLYLRELDLSNNSLRHIQYGVLEDLYFIRKLALEDNPWVCDYNIHYLLYWLKLHPGVQHSGLVCHSPHEFAGWSVQDYVNTYNGECPKDRSVALETGTQDASDRDPNALEPNDQDPSVLELSEGTGDEKREQLPMPLRGWKKYEIVRLS